MCRLNNSIRPTDIVLAVLLSALGLSDLVENIGGRFAAGATPAGGWLVEAVVPDSR